MKTSVSIYVVHHPECKVAEKLAKSLYDWFRLGYLSGDQSGAGLPVYYRRFVNDESDVQPKIKFEEARVNVVVVLVDEKLVVHEKWRKAMVSLAGDVNKQRQKFTSAKSAAEKATLPQIMLLPAALHDSFYRTGPLYEGFNPIRLMELNPDQQIAALRRAVTEATARLLRGDGVENPPPLNVFLSHAKKDGREITESIRDGVRRFGQLVPWYDANDLAHGSSWSRPMTDAASSVTAAMIATVTDAYPTRPWCRQEATLARTPAELKPKVSRVWKIQPVIAVHNPGILFVRGAAALHGVPRIGWNPIQQTETTERIVDRLVLEVLLNQVHRRVAVQLENVDRRKKKLLWEKSCYITWVPDEWTLSKLRANMTPPTIDRIVYPGYGLSDSEERDLAAVISTFGSKTKLVSFEEAMP